MQKFKHLLYFLPSWPEECVAQYPHQGFRKGFVAPCVLHGAHTTEMRHQRLQGDFVVHRQLLDQLTEIHGTSLVQGNC